MNARTNWSVQNDQSLRGHFTTVIREPTMRRDGSSEELWRLVLRILGCCAETDCSRYVKEQEMPSDRRWKDGCGGQSVTMKRMVTDADDIQSSPSVGDRGHPRSAWRAENLCLLETWYARGVAQSLASVLQASVNNDVVLQQNGRHKLNTLSLIVMAALR